MFNVMTSQGITTYWACDITHTILNIKSTVNFFCEKYKLTSSAVCAADQALQKNQKIIRK